MEHTKNHTLRSMLAKGRASRADDSDEYEVSGQDIKWKQTGAQKAWGSRLPQLLPTKPTAGQPLPQFIENLRGGSPAAGEAHGKQEKKHNHNIHN